MAKALCAVIYFTVLGDEDSVAPLTVWVGTVSPGTSKLQDRQRKVTEAKEIHHIVKLISGKLVAIENPLKTNKQTLLDKISDCTEYLHHGSQMTRNRKSLLLA